MTTNSDVSIRIATPADLESVRLFLRKYFFKDEPNNQTLKLITDDKPINEDLERFTFQAFGIGYDLVAEYEGSLVGVCLNAIIERGTPEEEFQCTPGNKFERIVKLLEHVERTVDYFGRYPDMDRLLTVLILSVDTSLRGKGIAKKLVARAKAIAKENKAKMIAVECTSFYSAAVSKSLGFEEIFSLKYADYKPNGEVVLQPPPPHEDVKVFILKI